MANISMGEHKQNKWRYNNFYYAVESAQDFYYLCASCGMRYNIHHDVSRLCHRCEIEKSAPRIKPGENWEEKK